MKKKIDRNNNQITKNLKSKKLLNEIYCDIGALKQAGFSIGWFVDQIEKIGATSFKIVIDNGNGDEQALKSSRFLTMKNVHVNGKDGCIQLDLTSNLPSNIARDAANGFSLKQFENGFAKNLGYKYRDFELRFHLMDGHLFIWDPVMPAQFLPYKKNLKCCVVVMKHVDNKLNEEEADTREETVKIPSPPSEEDFIK